MARKLLLLVFAVALAGASQAREMTSAYVITAVANKAGAGNTDWHTDLTIHNPHKYSLPLVLQFMPAGQDNSGLVPTVTFDVAPDHTLNLWNVLGPKGFDARGRTGMMFVYADPQRISCKVGTDCHFAAFSRTYTLNPLGGSGEFGQSVEGFPTNLGLDKTVLCYLPQISDDGDFRTNIGVASATEDWVTLRVDLRDAEGYIIDSRDHLVPPYGQIQWRLEHGVTGGTAVAYVVGGPTNSVLYPYASVINWATGDPVNVEAELSAVGLSAQSPRAAPTLSWPPRADVPGFDFEALQRRNIQDR